jgi:hypothetical protein
MIDNVIIFEFKGLKSFHFNTMISISLVYIDGVSPSGKATDFDSVIPRFKS